MAFVTRFAPSPTGPLHLGHAYSAILAHDMAQTMGGTFLLRIEDIDQGRSRPEWEAQIYDDLEWLGLSWAAPVMRQSERIEVYQSALDTLWDLDYLYPCYCTRRDIEAALTAPQEGAVGPDGPVYPGTCRKAGLPHSMTARPKDAALRLEIAAASFLCEHHVIGPGQIEWSLGFTETGPAHHGWITTTREAYATEIGDVVLARRDMGTSYHLSVVLDDAAQEVSHVVRGEDLFEATRIHVLLQRLLGLPVPTYHHHRLIRDDQGKRLAKRDDARALAKYRSEGATPADIRRMIGL
ncbi:MAG: tRNA glutamyl-Q(34) synthetase GluQRS [Pseudorhodobacter sp.]